MVQILGGTTTKLNIERINKLQKRVACIISKVDYITPSVEMFQRLRWMTAFQRINYNKAVLTYMALNNLTLSYLSDLLTPTAILYNRNLRSSENGSLMVPKPGRLSTPAPLQFHPLSYGTLSLHQLNKQHPKSHDRTYFILETAILL